MIPRLVVAAVSALALLAGCAAPPPAPEHLAAELAELPGVDEATGESVTGNPDQRSAAAFYVTVDDDATAAGIRDVVMAWLDRAPELRKGHLSLVVARPDASSTFALGTVSETDAADRAGAWFRLSRTADVRATIHHGSTEFAIDAADPTVALAELPPAEHVRLRLAVAGAEVAVLDAGACTFSGPRGEELWATWGGAEYCSAAGRD